MNQLQPLPSERHFCRKLKVKKNSKFDLNRLESRFYDIGATRRSAGAQKKTGHNFDQNSRKSRHFTLNQLWKLFCGNSAMRRAEKPKQEEDTILTKNIESRKSHKFAPSRHRKRFFVFMAMRGSLQKKDTVLNKSKTESVANSLSIGSETDSAS